MSNDPFTDGALRPTTSNATSLPSSQLRHQASQTSLRSGAGSAASNRPRQPRDLFPPPLSRRAPSRALRRVEDEVLADSDSERENVVAATTTTTTTTTTTKTRLRRVRRMSPESRSKTKSKQKQEEEISVFHKGPDGNFLREIPGVAEALKSHLMAQELADEDRIKAVDKEYVAVANQYFATGASGANTRGRKHEEDYEDLRISMLAHLRAQVLQNLEDERWRFEPTTS